MSSDDKQFKWLTPEAAVNFAYDLHVVNDPYSGKTAAQIAQKSLDFLHSFNPDPNSSDAWYYYGVLSIVVSHGNGISRRKKSLAATMESIHKFDSEWQQQMGKGQLWSLLLKSMWKLGGPVLMGVSFFLLTKVLSMVDLVPESLLNERGHTATIASALIACVVTVLTGVVNNWWSNYRNNRLRKEIDGLRYAAERGYEEGKRLELQTHWMQLSRLRCQYIDEEVCDMPAYSRVIEGDMAMRHEFNHAQNNAAKGDLSQLFGQASDNVHRWWQKRKNGDGSKRATSPQEPQQV